MNFNFRTPPNTCECPVGTYPIPNSNACGNCHYSCKKCSGPDPENCIECQINRKKINNLCSCEDSYFEPGDYGLLNGDCKPCTAGCL
jgi:hypothetical protein